MSNNRREVPSISARSSTRDSATRDSSPKHHPSDNHPDLSYSRISSPGHTVSLSLSLLLPFSLNLSQTVPLRFHGILGPGHRMSPRRRARRGARVCALRAVDAGAGSSRWNRDGPVESSELTEVSRARRGCSRRAEQRCGAEPSSAGYASEPPTGSSSSPCRARLVHAAVRSSVLGYYLRIERGCRCLGVHVCVCARKAH